MRRVILAFFFGDKKRGEKNRSHYTEKLAGFSSEKLTKSYVVSMSFSGLSHFTFCVPGHSRIGSRSLVLPNSFQRACLLIFHGKVRCLLAYLCVTVFYKDWSVEYISDRWVLNRTRKGIYGRLLGLGFTLHSLFLLFISYQTFHFRIVPGTICSGGIQMMGRHRSMCMPRFNFARLFPKLVMGQQLCASIEGVCAEY